MEFDFANQIDDKMFRKKRIVIWNKIWKSFFAKGVKEDLVVKVKEVYNRRLFKLMIRVKGIEKEWLVFKGKDV